MKVYCPQCKVLYDYSTIHYCTGQSIENQIREVIAWYDKAKQYRIVSTEEVIDKLMRIIKNDEKEISDISNK
ncbi:MAG: hypothetical protein ACFFC1_05605 [Promethearchaeota archaeon]